MKKMKIIVNVLLVISILMSSLVFADFDPSTLLTGPQQPGNAGQTASRILGVIQWLGYAIAVGMLIYIGIKYVMASADEKANLKNAMIRYVIGAVLIAGAATIAGWVFDIGKF